MLSPSATTAVLVSRSGSAGGGNGWSLTISRIASSPITARGSTFRIAGQFTEVAMLLAARAWALTHNASCYRVAESEGDMALPPPARMRKVEVWGI
ncbi:hypothetical protein GCM10010178_58750 [Lentzea flava]|uniref:Uncharacterized protein n=1 Tax=Lentzea flava TaxID=103732 RepID=A0ABQ2UYB3_9PSEU|nr:hypothetical protein GCM10010178_58750 [Lentzea flava]